MKAARHPAEFGSYRLVTRYMIVGALLRRRVLPQARVLNGLQSFATGSYAFVGSAEAEDEITSQLAENCSRPQSMINGQTAWK